MSCPFDLHLICCTFDAIMFCSLYFRENSVAKVFSNRNHMQNFMNEIRVYCAICTYANGEIVYENWNPMLIMTVQSLVWKAKTNCFEMKWEMRNHIFSFTININIIIIIIIQMNCIRHKHTDTPFIFPIKTNKCLLAKSVLIYIVSNSMPFFLVCLFISGTYTQFAIKFTSTSTTSGNRQFALDGTFKNISNAFAFKV